jgi:hypothetical protein
MSAKGTIAAKKKLAAARAAVAAKDALDTEHLAAVAPKPKAKKSKTVTPSAPAAAPAKAAKAVKLVPAGEKFCRYHNTTHPADLEHFASNKTAKPEPNGLRLYYICKDAEREQRAAKKAASAQPVAEVKKAKK